MRDSVLFSNQIHLSYIKKIIRIKMSKSEENEGICYSSVLCGADVYLTIFRRPQADPFHKVLISFIAHSFARFT